MGYDVSVGEDTNILSFEDVGEVGEYAIPAMQWAVGSGVLAAEKTLTPPRCGTSLQRGRVPDQLLHEGDPCCRDDAQRLPDFQTKNTH